MIKFTKFVHSCLLVQTPNATALFDPGVMSAQALDLSVIDRLDDIIITHAHADHFSPELLKKILNKFPRTRITTTTPVVKTLGGEGIDATDKPSSLLSFFDSPHEAVESLFITPPQIGVHFGDWFTHPGDSHSFNETRPILALPVTAPWGSLVNALNLALKLKPRHVLPIHDWHWTDEARAQSYNNLERILAENDIIFHKLETAVPVEIDL